MPSGKIAGAGAQSETLERLMPPELAEECEPLALLKEGADRQALLLRDRRSGEKLVLKRILHPAESAEEKYALLSRLGGCGIPKLRRFFRSGDAAYLLREYVEGETLLDRVQKRGSLPAEEAARIGIALCRTLRKLHGQKPPLIHRDIKAENIICTPSGGYVLIDFDISRFYDRTDKRDTELKGTAFSAPPEQFGYRQTDSRSDIYAMGVLLHELSTGECILEKGETPAPLRAIVKRCTRFDPKDRYQSAAALERALKRAAAGWRIRALRAVAAALIAVLTLGAAAGGIWAWRDARSEGIYAFESPEIEREVCRQLGKRPGSVTPEDLAQIKYLFLCGGERFDRWEQIDIHGADIALDGELQSSRGAVESLEDLRQLPNLRELALCNQQISDLSPLAGSGVQKLALHGNRIEDLSPLASCEQLLDLFISDNPVSDLSPLAACPKLCDLNVGATEIADLRGAAAIPNLRFLWMHDCPGVTDISAVFDMKQLKCLSIRPVRARDLPLIGSLRQLEQLYLWSEDAAEDLTALSDLTNLTRLFADLPLASLSGVEAMEKLAYLDVRSGAPLDPEPLLGLTALEGLNALDLRDGTLSRLAELPALRNVSGVLRQEAELRRAFASRPEVEIALY